MITGAKNSVEAWVDAQQEMRLCAQRAKERLMRDSSEEEVPASGCPHEYQDGLCERCGRMNPAIKEQNPKDLAGSRKPPLHLIPGVAMAEMATVLREGASKYGEWNWRRQKIGLKEYAGAILRHAFAFAGGEDVDPESPANCLHLAELMATAAIVIDAMEHDCANDNRQKQDSGLAIREHTLGMQMPMQGDEVE